MASVGLEVLSLKRVRVGGLRLPPSLRPGEYLQLSPAAAAAVTDRDAQAEATQRGREQPL